MMLATAAFSHRPWLPDVPFDRMEDFLHSVTAIWMAFAVAAGVVLVGMRRRPARMSVRVVDALAPLASVLIPLVMSFATSNAGALQRSVFLIAYMW